jgi:predicted GIY-YIG superfamily endonuclease
MFMSLDMAGASNGRPFLMPMHYVYILKSDKFLNRIYKGQTQDLKDRIKRHNRGEISHTSKFKPWKIIFYAAFETKKQAILFEKYLKTASGIAFMKKD